MSVSEAQLAANRANSRLSKGPSSPSGKRRSAANSLKHGLCSSVVLTEDDRLAQARAEEASDSQDVQDPYQRWLTSQAAVLTARIERSSMVEQLARDKEALRAEVSWDEDRRLESIRLGSKLADRPEEVAEQLRGTFHGCEWLMGRWAMLAYCADQKGGWTPEQTSIAFDLLGTPEAFREGHTPGTSLDFFGRVVAPLGGPAEMARRQIALLMERREQAADLDEAERTLAGSGLGNDEAPSVKLARRYEASLHNRLKWCMAQLKQPSPLGLGEVMPAPAPEPVAEVEPAPEPDSIDSPRAERPDVLTSLPEDQPKPEAWHPVNWAEVDRLRA